MSPSFAADKKSRAPSGPSTAQELETIKQTLADQSKQIESLTQQVEHLTQLLESKSAAAATPTPAPARATPAPEAQPTPVMVGASPAPGDTSNTHVVTKGETLTSIAKHYKVSVADLEKVNKIENDRMLQIGQTLVIPVAPASPAASTPPPTTPAETKENQ